MCFPSTGTLHQDGVSKVHLLKSTMIQIVPVFPCCPFLYSRTPPRTLHGSGVRSPEAPLGCDSSQTCLILMTLAIWRKNVRYAADCPSAEICCFLVAGLGRWLQEGWEGAALCSPRVTRPVGHTTAMADLECWADLGLPVSSVKVLLYFPFYRTSR